MEDQLRDFLTRFCGTLYQALPFIVLGALIAGILEELVPQQWFSKLLPRDRYVSILCGGLFGLVFPMCECGIVPVMRRLLKKGVPLSTCICYMLAGPIVNGVVMMSTFAAFTGMEAQLDREVVKNVQLGSVGMTTARICFGYLVAVLVSMIVEMFYKKHGISLLTPFAIPTADSLNPADNGPKRSAWQRVSNITETTLHDFVDITAFLIIGALLASLSKFIITPENVTAWTTALPGPLFGMLSIALMIVLAIALCLCSEADAFVAAGFKILPVSAKLAFLVLGPMLDVKLYLMFTRVFKPKLILIIIISVTSLVFVLMNIVHVVFELFPNHLQALSYFLEMKSVDPNP